MRRHIISKRRVDRESSGGQLVAAYQSALTNRSTAYTAQQEAKLSEQRAINYISETPANNNPVFVTPTDIPQNMQDTLAKASLDAHMKKVQADQIAHTTNSELYNLEQQSKRKYISRRVQITILEPNQHPAESYWQNSKTGKVTTGQINSKKIKGTIEDIVLSKNLLILAPTKIARIFNPERKLIAIYVINPETFAPMVSIILG